jgi:hypothetical protein
VSLEKDAHHVGAAQFVGEIHQVAVTRVAMTRRMASPSRNRNEAVWCGEVWHEGSAEEEPCDAHDEGYGADNERGEESNVFEDLMVSSVKSPANRNPTRRVDDSDRNRVPIAHDEGHTLARMYRLGHDLDFGQ